MVPGFPVLVPLEVEILEVLPGKFAPERFVAIRFADQLASARREIKGHHHLEIQRQMIVSRGLDLEGVSDCCGREKPDLVSLDRGVRGEKFHPVNAACARRFRSRGHRRRHDGFSRLQVLFEQQGRYGEHRADVVKTITGVIRRELLVRLKINAHQIADGVAVFRPIQTAQGGTARVGIFRVDAKNRGFDPLRDIFLLPRRRAGLFIRGHEVGAQILQHVPPRVPVFEEGIVRFKPVERQSAFFHAIPMAIVTILFKNRLDRLAKYRNALEISAPDKDWQGMATQPPKPAWQPLESGASWLGRN